MIFMLPHAVVISVSRDGAVLMRTIPIGEGDRIPISISQPPTPG